VGLSLAGQSACTNAITITITIMVALLIRARQGLAPAQGASSCLTRFLTANRYPLRSKTF
jgi:hypothetical protein